MRVATEKKIAANTFTNESPLNSFPLFHPPFHPHPTGGVFPSRQSYGRCGGACQSQRCGRPQRRLEDRGPPNERAKHGARQRKEGGLSRVVCHCICKIEPRDGTAGTCSDGMPARTCSRRWMREKGARASRPASSIASAPPARWCKGRIRVRHADLRTASPLGQPTAVREPD